ncbi:MAG: L,D-transpeptidase [Pseudomonadota bacterium]
MKRVIRARISKKNEALNSVGRVLPIVALGFAVQACSSSGTATSTYAALAPSEKLASNTSSLGALQRSQRIQNSRLGSEQFDYGSIYAAMVDDGNNIPAFDYTKMNRKYLRQRVNYYGPEKAGTIIVDARRRHLYLVERGGKAMRYGIAVGKEGYGWTGNSVLQWKQKWPTWTPPKEMIERKPELAKYAEGLKGDPNNPLGARAMYLFKNGKDTLYRIHGTNKPYSIGRAASSGCFRMVNQDVIDLYSRVGNRVAVQVRPEIQASLIEREDPR